MGDPFIGEIRLFAGDFAPSGWAFCDGTLLEVAEHEALFSLIGQAWGGDGVKDFATPDLRGRVPVGQGAGPGLSPRPLGSRGGVETVSLTAATMPAHSHAFSVTSAPATSMDPKDRLPAQPAPSPPTTGLYLKQNAAGAVVQTFDPNMLDFAGGRGERRPEAAAHANAMPSVAVNYIIALRGSYPPPAPGT